MALPPVDLPLVLARLRPGVDAGPGNVTGATYADLAKGWRAGVPVPTQAEVESEWAAVVAARRKPRQLADVMAAIAALAPADRAKLAALTDARFLIEHPGAAVALGINLAGDEPEGTPP